MGVSNMSVSVEVCFKSEAHVVSAVQSIPYLPHSRSQQGWLESLGVSGPVLGAEGAWKDSGWLSPYPQQGSPESWERAPT